MPTKTHNQAIKPSAERFPDDSIFWFTTGGDAKVLHPYLKGIA